MGMICKLTKHNICGVGLSCLNNRLQGRCVAPSLQVDRLLLVSYFSG